MGPINADGKPCCEYKFKQDSCTLLAAAGSRVMRTRSRSALHGLRPSDGTVKVSSSWREAKLMPDCWSKGTQEEGSVEVRAWVEAPAKGGEGCKGGGLWDG